MSKMGMGYHLDKNNTHFDKIHCQTARNVVIFTVRKYKKYKIGKVAKPWAKSAKEEL
jgi:hypothetical protein